MMMRLARVTYVLPGGSAGLVGAPTQVERDAYEEVWRVVELLRLVGGSPHWWDSAFGGSTQHGVFRHHSCSQGLRAVAVGGATQVLSGAARLGSAGGATRRLGSAARRGSVARSATAALLCGSGRFGCSAPRPAARLGGALRRAAVARPLGTGARWNRAVRRLVGAVARWRGGLSARWLGGATRRRGGVAAWRRCESRTDYRVLATRRKTHTAKSASGPAKAAR